MAAFLVALVASCSQVPIFYNIEREVLIEDGNLDNNISFTDMTKLTYSAEDYYLAAGKEIWFRRVTDKNWTKIGNPSGYTKSVSGTTGMAYIGGEIVSAFYSEPGTGKTALFSATFNGTGSVTWTMITGSRVDSHGDEYEDLYYTRYYLFMANNHLFINKVNYHNYYDNGEKTDIDSSQLYHFSNATIALNAGSQVTMPASFNKTVVRDVIHTGSAYWILYNNSGEGVIASGGSPGSMSEMTLSGVDNSCQFMAMARVGTLSLLSASTGETENHLYYSTDNGANWTRKKTDLLISCFLDISTIKADTVLAGCQSYVVNGTSYTSEGYVEFDTADYSLGSNSFSDDDNFDSSELSETSIRGLYLDSALDTVFALTWNKGLWRNVEENGERNWIWE